MNPTSIVSRGRSPTLCCAALLFLAACGGPASDGPSLGPTVAKGDISLGYLTESHARSTSSVSSIEGEEITRMRTGRFEELLYGVPGLMVIRRPDGGFSLQIRGVRSFMGSNEPLFVVDGMILQNVGRFSAADAINPGSVERIDVLKDAAALAIYGSRGANGVIVVTTKR